MAIEVYQLRGLSKLIHQTVSVRTTAVCILYTNVRCPSDFMPIGYHSLYCDGLSPDAKFPRERYPKLRQAIDIREDGQNIQWFHPRRATVEELSDIHDVGYILRFSAEPSLQKKSGKLDCVHGQMISSKEPFVSLEEPFMC